MTRPTTWKLILFGVGTAALLYGIYLIIDIKINEQNYTKLKKFEIRLEESFQKQIQSLNGVITAKNGFFTNEPLEINVNLSSDPDVQGLYLGFGGKNKLDLDTNTYSNQSIEKEIPLVKLSNSTWGNKQDFSLSKNDEYNLVIFGSHQNQTFSIMSNESIPIYNNFEQVQFEANKQTIKNGIIIEGLSWIVVGATAITFLAQVGNKN